MDNEAPAGAESFQEKLERIRKGKNREVLSEYIRIGQSDLYDYEPVRRAVLKEIAFLQVHDEQTKIPKNSPFKGQYEGWCYASQRFLAYRVGTTEGYVRNAVAMMEKDGVITTRLWKDSMGYPHQEYHVEEQVVTEHQREEDYMEYERKQPRRGGNKQANKGSFKLGNRVRATAHDSRSHRTPQPNATAHGSRNPPHSTAVMPPHFAADSGTAVESDKAVVGLGRTGLGGLDLDRHIIASELASVAAGAAKLETGSGVQLASLQKQKQPQQGVHGQPTNGQGTHGQTTGKKPLPNRLCYPEAFKNWRPGMRVPKCRVCGDNLQPQENHVCEGYEPKFPTLDHERRQAEREDLRESLSMFKADEEEDW